MHTFQAAPSSLAGRLVMSFVLSCVCVAPRHVCQETRCPRVAKRPGEAVASSGERERGEPLWTRACRYVSQSQVKVKVAAAHDFAHCDKLYAQPGSHVRIGAGAVGGGRDIPARQAGSTAADARLAL